MKNRALFSSLLSPSAQAILFALSQRGQKSCSVGWRIISGWAAATFLVMVQLVFAIAGGVFGLCLAAETVVALAADPKFWHPGWQWPAREPIWIMEAWPYALMSMAIALILFAWGPLSGSVKTRFSRFVIFENQKFEAAFDKLRPVLLGDAGWSRVSVVAALSQAPRALVHDVLAFGAGAGLAVAMSLAIFLAPIGLLPLTVYFLWKACQAAPALKGKLFQTMATLQEEGAEKLAQGERDLLAQETLAGAVGADGSTPRPARKPTRI